MIAELRQKTVSINGKRTHIHKLKDLLIVSGMTSRQYRYLLKEIASGGDKYSKKKETLMRIYRHSRGTYGSPRLTAEMRKEGMTISRKTVAKMMVQLGVQGVPRPKMKKAAGPEGKAASNLMQRDFNASRPYEKMVTDVTEFNVCGSTIYLMTIKDLCDKRIIAYTISRHANCEMAIRTVMKMARELHVDATPMIHSDQGNIFTSIEYQDALRKLGISQSMSRRGNCWDNAVAESFFSTLKQEFYYRDKFASVDEFVKQLRKYIHYYNYDRISTRLGGLTPVEYRNTILKTIIN